jgi:UDP-N-acetylmuramoylalanine--D-glutamate ligase
VINADDPLISRRALDGLTRGKLVPFTVSGRFTDGVYLDGDRVVWSWDGVEEVYPAEEIALKGLHNMENVMAAVAAARLLGVEREAVARTLGKFTGLPHRMETVRELGGVTYINDSKGTNVGSLKMALRGISAPVVLIAGGVDKGGDYSSLAPLVREKVRLLVLMGEAADRIEATLGQLTRTVRAGSLEEAVSAASAGAEGGDTVLLCPACSSFDMFADYRDRGERFRELVSAL